MGCGSSQSVKTASEGSLQGSRNTRNGSRVHPSTTCVNTEENKEDASPELEGKKSQSTQFKSSNSVRNAGIAFEVMLNEGVGVKPAPKRLSSRLEPIDAPRLTAEELEEKMRIAERKRNSELEARAKTASETRRQSKRKRELLIARELERQHHQARELEDKLKSAERQRELKQQQVIERQHRQEERMRRVRNRKEKLQTDEVISDVEQDDNFNNDDVDSWLEGSNNGTNTVDTGFSSATSERIYSGRESPKKKLNNTSNISRSSYLNSASTVDSCDILNYKQNYHKSLSKLDSSLNSTPYQEGDEFFDT